MLKISAEKLGTLLDYPSLIQALKEGFTKEIQTPQRHHHDFNIKSDGSSSTLLIMPSWQDEAYLGIKIVTLCPNNNALNLPTIQGRYLLYDANNGQALAELDGPEITNLRTAATSALASTFLSREESSKLLMIGTGSLARYLIEAHLSVRPLQQVFIWGRNLKNAQHIADQFDDWDVEVSICGDLNKGVQAADIISVATLSPEPLVLGKNMRPGQHLDLVGAYKPDMREADDDVIRRANIYYDTPQGIKESGDLFIPLRAGLIDMSDLKGNIIDLCQGEIPGRQNSAEITVFKSVGHASEDLIAAVAAYEKCLSDEN